jgi:transcriptional regulator with XRE-family HTH domain
VSDRLFSALLQYWRRSRGLSQLDLALAADVSARHVSFLESGRSRPGEAMVERLMAALDVPLRGRNEALLAAGFPARYAEPALHDVEPAVEDAIARMMAQQEPFPLTVLSAGYDVLRANRAAGALFSRFVAEPAAVAVPLNMFSLVFDPRLARPFVAGWETVARQLLARLHRELLRQPADATLRALLDRVLASPGVPAGWQQPDLSEECGSTLEVRLHRDGLRVGFLTTVTVFSAPRLVTLDELRIESYFPLDAATTAACAAFATRPP